MSATLAQRILPDPAAAGEEMHALLRELYPIPRSLTGDGVRETLRRIGRDVPLDVVETPTGTQVFDWVAPREWNLREAWIEAPDGRRVLDSRESSLHVLGYSVPVDAVLPLEELREHVYTHETDPDAIPYRTSYYTERWGFCMSANALARLEPGDYRVHIDATLADGSVTYGEIVLPGRTDDVFLLTTYVCHPALANDNLSGVVLLAVLGRLLHGHDLRHTYRLLFSPGTIGPLCWLARNRDTVERVRHGVVVSAVGDPGDPTYKRSRRGNADVDRAVEHVLRTSGVAHTVLDWFPWGGDERQFCSPGFDLPVGALSRTPADKFPEYHSSLDDPEFVRPAFLASSLQTVVETIASLELDATFVNLSPHGEPQLGRRGLYRSVGGGSSRELALLWMLSLSDGRHSVLDIAVRSGLPVADLRSAADALLAHGLLEQAAHDVSTT